MFKGVLQPFDGEGTNLNSQKQGEKLISTGEIDLNLLDMIFTHTTEILRDEDIYKVYDKVFLDDSSNVKPLKYYAEELRCRERCKRVAIPSDYAVLNNLCHYSERDTLYKKNSCFQFLQPFPMIINSTGNLTVLNKEFFNSTAIGMCPVIHVDAQKLQKVMENNPNIFKIEERDIGKFYHYHVINFGKYPTYYVGDKENSRLEKLYHSGKLKEKKLNKTAPGYLNGYKLIRNEVYDVDGEEFVRTDSKKYNKNSKLSTGQNSPATGSFAWVKVEDIWWKIRNYKKVPKFFNPIGKGNSNYLDLQTEKCLISGLPYKILSDDWQYSLARSFLNKDFLNFAFQERKILTYNEEKKDNHLRFTKKAREIAEQIILQTKSLSKYQDPSVVYQEKNSEQHYEEIDELPHLYN